MAASSFRKESLRMTFRRVSTVNSTNSGSGIATFRDSFDFQHVEPEIVSWANCQEIVLRLLQGAKVDTLEKVTISASVRHLINNTNLANLLCDSIQRQLLPQAFKGLVADVATSNSPVKQLTSTWILIYTVVLPDFQTVFCSLTECTKFDTKKVLLTAYRDSLLIGYPGIESKLLHFDTLPSDLWQMLLVLEYATRDNTDLYRKLESLCCQNIADFEPIVMRNVNNKEENATPTAQSLPKSPVFKTYSKVTWAKDIHDLDNSTRRHSSAQCSTVLSSH